MLILDGTRNRGMIEILVRRASGRIDRYLVKNLFTDGGLGYLSAREAGEAVNVISHMALGIGTTPAAGPETTLESEIAGSRVPITITGAGSNRIYSAVFADGVGNGPVTESGLFNDPVAGLMTNHSVFGAKTKEPGEIFTFNWTLSHLRG